ncbi:putative cathepsin C precursor [Babesia divergens]|uniref:Dipeptidyl peptidase 1 n=1 Tax=Babesia divergens TaxID=32595 RepID=A0AAD9G9N2_BABDI|nr:putative cathepsin C precursor [Babesia divergens]
MVTFLYVLALLLAAQHAQADLPIHALIRDIAGKWRFHKTQPLGGLDVTCGSDMPNTVEGNLMLGNYLEYLRDHFVLEGSSDFELTLDLTAYADSSNKRNRQQWRALAVKDSEGNTVGRWTSVYDQGFEVLLNDGTRYFFYMHFTKQEGDHYETNVHSTHIGWAYTTETSNSAETIRRCAYGHKLDGKRRETTAIVKLLSNDVKDKYRQIDRAIKNGSWEIAPAGKGQVKQKKGSYPCNCSNMEKLNFYDNIPRAFQWKDKVSLKVDNQKHCGNCYAIASRYVLQSRFLIALERMQGLTAEQKMALQELSQFPFDDSDATTCDMFNQGCKGGYPYLTGKRMREFGLLTKNHANGQCSVLSQQRRYFAKDYGYVGGCYQCTACQGEQLIMREVFANGPVVTAMDASVMSDDYDGTVITFDGERTNAGICDVKDHPILSGWEYTSHAVVIVGWDEQVIDGQLVKYWICRNSWGEEWGEHGYFKIERGKNLFGIESEAVFIDPDLTRFTQKPNSALLHDVHNHIKT